MNVLVTGACGFVGSTLIRELLAARPEMQIWGVDNFMREGSRLNVQPLRQLGVTIIEGDIRNPPDLESLPKPEWVLDCAAEPSVLAGVGGSVSSFGVMDHNLIGTIRLLELCKNVGAGFILLSTSRVYSIQTLATIPVVCRDSAYTPACFDSVYGLTPAGITENFPTAPPLSLYGASKRCSEIIALEYGAAFGFPVWINRCGVLAGRGQFGKIDQGIFSFWIRSWASGQPLAFIGFDGRGSQVRDCLHPRDLTPVLLRQMDDAEPNTSTSDTDGRICNFGGGRDNAMSLAQLSRWCELHIGEREVDTIPATRPFDLPWVVLDSTKARQLWNWQPITPIEAILQEILDSTPGPRQDRKPCNVTL